MRTSETVSEIAKALAKVQGEIKNPSNTGKASIPTKKGGSFSYTYAPLPDILSAVRPLLAKNGLSVIQSTGGDGRNITVTTMLLHTSGEWIESDPLCLIADGGNAQAAGAAITYGRRYALAAVLGISSEDDDDGSRASAGMYGSAAPPRQAPAAAEPKSPKDPKAMTTPQMKKLYALIGEKFPDADEAKQAIYGRFKIESVKELTSKTAGDVIEWLQTLPDAQVGE